MSGNNNVLQWNPTQFNQETDDQYSSDPMRSSGAPTGQTFPSALANKLFYQLSTVIAALAQALSNKGYNIVDSNLQDLVASLSNLMTLADMLPYALLDSPHFVGSPTTPTPPAKDSSTRIATTAFAGGAASFQPNGYQRLPNGLILQWCQGATQVGGGETPHTINFPIPFPTACLSVQLTTQIEANHNDADTWFQLIGAPLTTGITVKPQSAGGGGSSATFTCYVFAIGY